MSRKTCSLVAALGLIGFAILAHAEEMRVRDIPIPDEATDVSTMKRRGDIRFRVKSDFKTAGNFYTKKLTEQKWTKSKKDNLQRNFWVQKFEKDRLSLEVRVDSRDGGSEVRLTPQGLMWEEDDQPTPKDLPLPKDATEIEYDDFFESIEFKSPTGVKLLAESLTKELDERKWIKKETEYDLENFVRMKFSQGKSTLSIDIRNEDSGSEVAIRTKGMQWDGMKAEIKRTKEKSKKIVGSSDRNKKNMADKPMTFPKRKEKPKQGIDKMPKLPNEGAVVMDGKTYQLSNVIAYEVFENAQWSTKVIATQRPVNQQSLISRLKLTGTDKNADESTPTWPQPYLLIVLEEDDLPWRLELNADKTPGGGTGSALAGSTLVEDGRARGTVKLKEPGSFFDKVYTAEISFDVTVLTRESSPAKQLTDAPRLV
ncbi:hypothetical protein FJZ55_09540, partial [Candidatus Woesearchaeota archaeon]|nr:hypothetical protein [Candidatus Woesearchaeota archaeon]